MVDVDDSEASLTALTVHQAQQARHPVLPCWGALTARPKEKSPQLLTPVQLELEKRRISELGDVLQRIEKHASGELAARLRAEELEREALDEAAHEREQRARLEEEARGKEVSVDRPLRCFRAAERPPSGGARTQRTTRGAGGGGGCGGGGVPASGGGTGQRAGSG